MAKALTKKQIEEEWIKAGGKASEAPLKAAIALAESGGDPSSVNPEGPEHAEGLWQIKGQIVKGDPLNPSVSALNAVAKTKSQGNSAWTTYTSGAYKAFLGPSELKVGPGGYQPESGKGEETDAGTVKYAGAGGETVNKAAEGAEATVTSVAGFLGKVSKLWEEPKRTAKFIGGSILLAVGLKALTTGSSSTASFKQVGVQTRHVSASTGKGTLKLAKKAAKAAVEEPVK